MAYIQAESHNTRYDRFGNSESGLYVSRECEWCHCTFRVLRRQAVRAGRGRFCSRSCLGARNVAIRNSLHTQAGPGNGNWKGGVSRQPYRYTLRFRVKSPEKYAVQGIVHRAVQSGLMVRPKACSACATPCVPHAHHEDYSRPYDVRWLCAGCHVRLHHLGRKRSGAVHTVEASAR